MVLLIQRFHKKQISKWWKQTAEIAFSGLTITSVSELNDEECRFMDYFNYSWKKRNNLKMPLETCSIEEIILRCRLLRNLKRQKALDLIKCAWNAWNIILDQLEPKYCLSITVDSYILDILARICDFRGIQFIGICNSPLNGLSLITERGEYNHVRQPGTLELESTLEEFSQITYRPNYLSLTQKKTLVPQQVKKGLYNLARRGYFTFRSLYEPLNYNSMAYPFLGEKIRFFNNNNRLFQANSYHNWISSRKPKLYVPLHFYPEATIDYWTDNLDFIDYGNILKQILQILSNRFSILVKEHPAAYWTRPNSFYDSIPINENIFFVSPDISSNQIIEKTDVVLTWTGTAGLEARLRGKSVILMGDPYYFLHNYFIKIKKLEELSQNMDYFINSSASSDLDIKPLFKHVLSGTLKGRFLQHGFVSDENATILGNSIAEYITNKRKQ